MRSPASLRTPRRRKLTTPAGPRSGWPATGGEADMLETVAEVCCSLVAACDLAGDAGRLEQWARIVAGFVERRGDLSLLRFCRTCNAEMLAATGHHQESERELLASAAS